MSNRERVTFGQAIAKARRDTGLSLREAAALILKEDGTHISNQYLSDLENDRRNPPSDGLIEAIAGVYGVSSMYLYFVARRIPQDIENDTTKATAFYEELSKRINPPIAA